MIIINYDLVAGTAKTTQSAVIKTTASVPVQIVFSDPPGNLTGIQLALGADAAPTTVLAFMDVDSFAQDNETTWTGTLDASDPRLVSFMTGKTPVTVDAELAVAIDGVRQISPNFQVTVQLAIINGPTLSEGGPAYYTATQVNDAIAAALANLPAKTVSGKYRIKDDGTVELWNPDQSKWHALTIHGAAGAEVISIGAGES